MQEENRGEQPSPKKKRGRPRVHADRHAAWKKRTDFEKSEARKAYKREWNRRKGIVGKPKTETE